MDIVSLSLLFTAYLTCFIGSVIPGPNIFMIVETTLRQGKKYGFILATGMALGSSIWGVFTVFGLTTILISFPLFFYVIKILGGAVLLFLSIKSFITVNINNSHKTRHMDTKSGLKVFCLGLMVQAVNPKTAISWLTIYAVALTEKIDITMSLLIIFGNAVIALLVNSTYALYFSKNIISNVYEKNTKKFSFIVGCIYFILGLALLFYSFTEVAL